VALASPHPAGRDPHPQTTAVLAALFARSLDAAPPAADSAPRVEAAIASVGVETASERLAAILANPAAERPLTYHVEAIRGTKPKRAVGDLGCETTPWPLRLTDDEARAYREERDQIAPNLTDAPIGIVGPNNELRGLNSKYRSAVEGRT
jgi:hypothetical protein